MSTTKIIISCIFLILAFNLVVNASDPCDNSWALDSLTQVTVLSVWHQSNTNLNVEDVQSNLANESFLSYFILDNVTYGILINQSNYQVFRCKTDVIMQAIENIYLSLDQVYQANFKKNQQQFVQASIILYQELIEPIKKSLKERITIVVDAPFSGIPWDALHAKNEGEAVSSAEYLLYDHEITITHEKFSEIKIMRSSNPSLDMLGIAPEFSSSLFIENEEELQQVSNGLKNELMLDNLGHSQVLDAIQKNSAHIIHISSHAEMDSIDGNKTGILLNGLSDIITVEQIRNLKITPELVFLNTCGSARKNFRDQNSTSITEAFLEAGARSTIGTLWEIDDQVAQEVAIETYAGLKEGKRISEALRSSKIKLIQNAKIGSHAHPYFWAPYQAYGENCVVLDIAGNQFKRLGSLIFSVLTTFSMAYYYFSNRVRKFITDQNWI